MSCLQIGFLLASWGIVNVTLTTKIMLGVFGNVIAIDKYNRKAFGIRGFKRKTFKELKSSMKVIKMK